MFRTHSPFGGDTGSYAESMKSFGDNSVMDETASQLSVQRKDYATSINKMMEKFQYRVEHLFTCDLDGRELRNIIDCVERLKLLDQTGRVWGQDMLMEVHGSSLQLIDIETKEELESVALSDIQAAKAVLNMGVFNSLLTVSVQSKRKRMATVFMFQCDDVRADYIERDLSRAMSRKREEPSFRNNTAEPVGPGMMGSQVDQDRLWATPDYEDDQLDPELALPLEDDDRDDDFSPDFTIPGSDPPYTETDRNVDIFNHILNDIEIFIGRIAAVEAKNATKKKKKKKKELMPTVQEFVEVLQKIKFGFNHLVLLKGQISNPDVPDFVHSLFSTLAFVASRCPKDLPPTIVAPLLTPETFRLLSDEVTAAEDQLWQSLGDAWNTPSTQWRGGDQDTPSFHLRFSDGWQPRDVNAVDDRIEQTSGTWKSAGSPRRAHSTGSKLRAKWDFVARNHQELTVIKGELLEILDLSKQWWKVKNNRGEEGYVPNKLLEDPDEMFEEEIVSPVLTKKSKPPEVKAWLIDKGFSQITVRCLGGLTGASLLQMSREELKMVCPEEGGRVFFRLQAVRAALNS
ncbi:unnamed protein product [Ophioblennius macclurei]